MSKLVIFVDHVRNTNRKVFRFAGEDPSDEPVAGGGLPARAAGPPRPEEVRAGQGPQHGRQLPPEGHRNGSRRHRQVSRLQAGVDFGIEFL